MRRRSLLLFAALSPIGLFCSRYLSARTSATAFPRDSRKEAQQLNELAGNIQTLADARHFVDLVAALFAEQLPPALLRGSLRDRIAQAEFAAVSDSQKLIPEQRIAEAWNAYVHTVGISGEFEITPAEVHGLRDAFWVAARLSWNRDHYNIWAAPAIYATQAEGTLAPGCRAIEAIRVLGGLALSPDNLRSTRDRIRQGVLFSDQFREALKQSPAPPAGPSRIEGRVRVADSNPVEAARTRYIADYGMRSFSNALIALLDRTLT